jgi:epsilon-lactone hydrolase
MHNITAGVKTCNRYAVAAALFICLIADAAMAADQMQAAQSFPGRAAVPPITNDGTVTVPAFDLPFSSFASEAAKDALVKRLRHPMPIDRDIAKMRQITDTWFEPNLAMEKQLYPYTSQKSKMGGVPVESFVPAAGIAPQNVERVIVNLHGGGFITGGGGPAGALEAVPLASIGRIKIIAVDYRMAPEYHFPAASEDVAAVYRELLKTYRPENIGFFGCSAGGMLTGETIPWFLKEKLPLPGALAIVCASLHMFGEGDSSQIAPRLGSVVPIIPPVRPEDHFGPTEPYFAGVSVNDPLAVPGASKDVMKAFPPTLFLTGTRAPEMSGAAQSHLELTELGVKSELLLFDGLDHGFYSDPSLPESKTAYSLIARFFMENLGSKR